MGLTLWAILFFAFAPSLPDTQTLWQESASPSIVVLDEEQRVIETRGGAGRRPVSLSELPDYVGEAIIAIEDKRFYDHFGLDVVGLARAMITNLTAGRVVQGGSTITQQLAKNIFLSHERSLKRKVEELILAIWLETRLDKDEILALYLNRVYFGAGAYGIETAARRYFNKSPRALTLAEAAMLAGVLTAPSILAPTNNLKRAQERANLVINLMHDNGFIDERAAEEAKTNPARPAPKIAQETGYFVELVMSMLDARFGRPAKDTAIRTTLDLDIQRVAERAVNSVFDRELVKDSPLEASLVIIDTSGGIKAMLGGRFYQRSSYNRSIQANRQVGSAYKPFVVAAALEAGLTPNTTIEDKPITVDGWSPRNAGNEFVGKVTLNQALARSLNAATVRVSEAVGRDKVLEMAARLGIDHNPQPVPAIALGITQASPLAMARAYAPFANQGRQPTTYVLNELRHGGEATLTFKTPEPVQVLSPNLARDMAQMLEVAVKNGTGRVANDAGCDAAGKTGTTQQARDAWFIGFCRGYIGAVWVGFDDNRPMRGVTGGGLPTKIWTEIFRNLPDASPIPTTNNPDVLADALANEGLEWLLENLQAQFGQFLNQ